MLIILDANGVKHKWDLETEKWVVYEESEKSKETSKEESQKSTKESSEEESEEDENTTDEQRKERMFRKRKCQPGWTKLNYFTDPETVKGSSIQLKRKLEKLQFSTSSSFVKILSAWSCEFKAYFFVCQNLKCLEL